MTRIPIKPGITGLFGGDALPPPEVSTKDILTSCYWLAREHGWSIGKLRGDDYYNFRFIAFSFQDLSIAALFNNHYPVMTFCENFELESYERRYWGNDDIVKTIHHHTPFYAMSKAEAERPLEPDDLTELSQSDLYNVRSWKPECLGDLIFNFYD